MAVRCKHPLRAAMMCAIFVMGGVCSCFVAAPALPPHGPLAARRMAGSQLATLVKPTTSGSHHVPHHRIARSGELDADPLDALHARVLMMSQFVEKALLPEMVWPTDRGVAGMSFPLCGVVGSAVLLAPAAAWADTSSVTLDTGSVCAWLCAIVAVLGLFLQGSVTTLIGQFSSIDSKLSSIDSKLCD
mmetsp:Transcript_53415/g.98778  ORF Transcript_53415/g.98778 Transcript_53415/m.98778 type:complete len:188 (+) Transcript_53415:53-616(+)